MLKSRRTEPVTTNREALRHSSPKDAFDRITRLAACTLAAPLAAISLDGDTCGWTLGRHGPAPMMTPHAGSPCAAVVSAAQPLWVEDLAASPVYRSGLLATLDLRFYAAAPLLQPDGAAIGTIWVASPHPRQALATDMALLQDLAGLAMQAVGLHDAARTDPLSGLPNRCQLLDDMAGLEPGIARQLALIDLAHPDELAHMLRSVGSACFDEMVRRDADTLQALLGAARLYHVAATRFALLAPSGEDAATVAQRLRSILTQAAQRTEELVSAAHIIAVVIIEPGQLPPAEQLRRAHTALDGARVTQSAIALYTPNHDAGFRRAFTLLDDFAAALDEPGSLRLVFQPRIDLKSTRCVGVEALIRWTHPTLGEVPPAEFVRLIEKTTLARGLMHWVLAHALEQLVTWRKAGLRLQLSVNVSPAALEDGDFATHVLAALDAARLPPAALELEITESALLNEAGPALRHLHTLSAAGLCVAIDDFGTGYSSLSYLQRLPADVVKIDQSFIRGLCLPGADGVRYKTLVTAMIGLCHDLGYRVVAEGIETQAAADILLDLRCDEVQGYWFGRPMPAKAFVSWHAQRHWAAGSRWSVPAPRRADTAHIISV